MVRRAALLLLLVLSLAGCGFFTASLFPGYLAQAEKSYELGSGIDNFLAGVGSADYRWHPQVFVLTRSPSWGWYLPSIIPVGLFLFFGRYLMRKLRGPLDGVEITTAPIQ